MISSVEQEEEQSSPVEKQSEKPRVDLSKPPLEEVKIETSKN
mgnify:CR=1 FL=1